MAPIHFSHKVVPITCIVTKYYEFSPFLQNFPHLIDFMPICPAKYTSQAKDQIMTGVTHSDPNPSQPLKGKCLAYL